jgi:uncharacterized membrane protein YsdA (DUF1294 family)
MTYSGIIVSHDPSLHTGLVMPDESAQAVSFTEGDVLNWDRQTVLLGQRVSFSVVQTSQGFAAIHLMLPRPQKRHIMIEREYAAAVVGPVAVLFLAGLLYYLFFWPLIISYVTSINFVSLMMLTLVASSGRQYKLRPPEIAVVILALAGGAPAVMLGSYLLPTRFRTEQTIFLFGAIAICQALALHRFFPEFYDKTTWITLIQ